VLNLNQAAINGIRGAGATSQYIFAEGNAWTGAWDWVSVNGGNMAQLTDPEDKLVYEMHQYLDSDYSGTSTTCQSETIGADSLVGATNWLRTNGKLGFVGEYAAGVNSVCETAITNMLNYMETNSDVWLGASWWAAGPWWGTYIYSLEPNSGVAYGPYMPILTQYLPGKAPPTGSSTTTTTTTTTSSHITTSSPTTTTTHISTTSTTTTSASGPAQTHWGQCGGLNWKGATSCTAPYTCQVSNPYYSQCL
jgi:endoglucanase